MTISQTEIDAIVCTKIKEMYGDDESKIVKATPEQLIDWWKNRSLSTLISSDSGEVKLLSSTLEPRTRALEQMQWAATKIVALGSVVESCLGEFIRLSSELPELGGFKATVTVLVIGSVGRLESSAKGDIDINILGDVPPMYSMAYTTALRANLTDSLFNKANQLLSDFRGFSDVPVHLTEIKEEDFRFLTFAELAAKPPKGFALASYVNYSCGCHVLKASDSWHAFSAKVADSRQITTFQRNLRFKTSGEIEKARLEALHSALFNWLEKNFYKTVVAGLLILAATEGVEPKKFHWCYFRLAEHLSKFALPDWETIQIAVLTLMDFRSHPENVIKSHELLERRRQELLRFTRLVERYAK